MLRRRISSRISLRTLFFGVAVLACFCALFSRVERTRRQYETSIASLRELGAYAGGYSALPSWVFKIVPRSYLVNWTLVSLNSTTKNLVQIPAGGLGPESNEVLKSTFADPTQMAQIWSEVRKLPGQRNISIAHMSLEPWSLDGFSGEVLVLAGLSIDELTLRNIGQAQSLFRIYFHQCRIAPEMFQHLHTAGMLRQLEFNQCKITDNVLAGIEQCQSLEQLTINHYNASPRLTDIGLRHIARVPNLRSIEIRSSDISDESVETIISMPSLKSVNLGYSRVSPEGAERLRRERPDIQLAGQFGPETSNEEGASPFE